MSVWKKTSKAHQKTYRERHQPEARKHLGLLEKKKDYIVRAKDYNEKRDTLKLLRKRALNKNPDEFYHHMINSKIEDGSHVEKPTEDEDTPEQLKFKRTQDLQYISFVRTQELRKIERMQSELHLTSVDHNLRNKHLIFPKNLEGNFGTKKESLSSKELPDVDLNALKEAAQSKKKSYKELGKRIERERELAIIQQKLEVKRKIESGKNLLPPKRIQRGTKTSAPVYQWRYERKK